eukprot:UN10500
MMSQCNFMSHYNLGSFYESIKSFKKALVCLKKAYDLNPNDCDIQYSIALLNESYFKNYTESTKYYDMVLEYSKDNKQLYYTGRFFEKRKK